MNGGGLHSNRGNDHSLWTLLLAMLLSRLPGFVAPVPRSRDGRGGSFVRLWGMVQTDFMVGTRESFPPRRNSASADAAMLRELERLRKMTIEERVKAALSMGHRFSWLKAKDQPTTTNG